NIRLCCSPCAAATLLPGRQDGTHFLAGPFSLKPEVVEASAGNFTVATGPEPHPTIFTPQGIAGIFSIRKTTPLCPRLFLIASFRDKDYCGDNPGSAQSEPAGRPCN